MQPIDYRNATWEDIAGRLNKDRNAVYMALLRHGPATTRDLARAMGWDILNVRPRVTELCQIGLVALVEAPAQTTGREGIYEALSWAEARREFERRKSEAAPRQLNLL
jgi:predicted transcriptional regulator